MRYPNSADWVLNGLNLQLAVGERLALIGCSGCGKSTVARVVLQLLPPKSVCKGNVMLDGKSFRNLDSVQLQKLRGQSVGLVFQDPMTRLNPLMTIGNHLLDTLKAHKKNKSFLWRQKRAEELLERVGINPDRFDSFPHEFSGGMRQRVGIALAIALNPPLVIADEPTTSLDVAVANQVMTQLSNLCDDFGTALLLITHDLAMAAKWCNRMSILDQGMIVEDASCSDLLIKPRSEVGKRLVAAARLREGSGKTLGSRKKIVLRVDNLRCWHPLSSWSWKVKWIKAIDQVSFSICEGETLGIVGSSGCGKSTLCRALMGLIPVRGGTVSLEGKDLLNISGNELKKSRKLVQMVFQDPLACLNPKMTIGEAISDPMLIHGLCSKSQAKEQTRNLLHQVGLNPAEDFQHRFPQELSGGQQQRIAIARSLSLQPKLLICDESVSMLDAEIQTEILILLKTLQRKFGLAILFITHDLSVANGFCDRLILLDQGKIIEECSGSEIFNNPQTALSRRLVNASPRLPLLS